MTKAPTSRGSVYKRKDGRFVGALFMTTASGAIKRVPVYGRTKAEAEAKLDVLRAQRNQGLLIPDETWRLSDYLDHWLEHTVAKENRPRTYELYESVSRLYLKPYIGRISLTNLSISDAQAAFDKMKENGVSQRRIEQSRTALSSALSHAMRRELLFRNVARLVKIKSYKKQPIYPWTPAEAVAFLESIRSHPWESGYLLNVLYGVRRGEALGLRWGDIDFVNGTFSIQLQLQRINGVLQFTDLKTDTSRRTLPLIPYLRSALLRHAERYGIQIGPTGVPLELLSKTVIVSSVDTLVDPKNYVREFHAVLKKHGIRRIKLHHTRHTVGSFLKGLGVSRRDTQLMLGHASPSTTEEIYQLGNLEEHRAILEKLSAKLTGNLSGASLLESSAANTSADCCQPLLSSTREGTSTSRKALLPNKENRRSPEVESAEILGGPSETRTQDTLLKRPFGSPLMDVPTPVVIGLHRRTQRRIMGHVAVKMCCHGDDSVVNSQQALEDLLTRSHIEQNALAQIYRAISFPLNLLPSTPLDS